MACNLFIDSSFLVSLYNTEDANHPKAQKISSMLPEEATLYISTQIISESLTILSQRVNRKTAIDMYSDISVVELVYIDIDTFNKSLDLFKKVKSKNVSFADCTSFVICKELEIDAVLTFDKHFKKQGLKIFPD